MAGKRSRGASSTRFPKYKRSSKARTAYQPYARNNRSAPRRSVSQLVKRTVMGLSETKEINAISNYVNLRHNYIQGTSLKGDGYQQGTSTQMEAVEGQDSRNLTFTTPGTGNQKREGESIYAMDVDCNIHFQVPKSDAAASDSVPENPTVRVIFYEADHNVFRKYANDQGGLEAHLLQPIGLIGDQNLVTSYLNRKDFRILSDEVINIAHQGGTSHNNPLQYFYNKKIPLRKTLTYADAYTPTKQMGVLVVAYGQNGMTTDAHGDSSTIFGQYRLAWKFNFKDMWSGRTTGRRGGGGGSSGTEPSDPSAACASIPTLKAARQVAIDALEAAIFAAGVTTPFDIAADAAVIFAEGALGIAESALFAAELICYASGGTEPSGGSTPTEPYDSSEYTASVVADVLKHPHAHVTSATHASQSFYGVDPDDSTKVLVSLTGHTTGSSGTSKRLHLSTDTTCDILMVAAGGGGSYGIGGGGGAGAVLFMQDHVLKAGHYQLIAGPGGSGGSTMSGSMEPGLAGSDVFLKRLDPAFLGSVISVDATIKAYGGGGGAQVGSFGGSGGGGDGWPADNGLTTSGQSAGSGVSTTSETLIVDTYTPVISVNDGGSGGNSGGYYHYGGGGGGAGGDGYNGSTSPDYGIGGGGGAGKVVFGTTYSKGGNGSGWATAALAQPTNIGSGGNGGNRSTIGDEPGEKGRPGCIKIFLHSV